MSVQADGDTPEQSQQFPFRVRNVAFVIYARFEEIDGDVGRAADGQKGLTGIDIGVEGYAGSLPVTSADAEKESAGGIDEVFWIIDYVAIAVH